MRKLIRKIDAMHTNEGDGVKITRIGGRHINALLDPFLLFDEINTDEAADYMGGFPEHPHRGFETITYMKAGRMRHRDHMGNEGVVEPGGVQWMTAGKGVLHSEMPEQENGLFHGFQIWLNLPASEKFKPAAYYDMPSDTVATVALKAGGVVRLIAGYLRVEGVELIGPLPALTTNPVMMDVELNAEESVALTFNTEMTAWVYVYSGALNTDNNVVNTRQMGFYTSGERLHITAGKKGVKALVFSGKPIKEPIAQYGPFVMNTSKEIEQAFAEYRKGTFVSL